jgi:hypothetical protein
MSKFQEYVAQMASLANPTPLPDGMATLYAVSLDLPIEHVRMEKDRLEITFSDGQLVIWDDGRNCCENRYMTTDDDLSSFVGAKLLGYEAVAVDDTKTEYDECHEQMFVKVETTKGTITLVTHNEHNGYYGGFDVRNLWVDK